MNNQTFENLLLKTAFCCMASDGDIDPNEIATIKNLTSDSDHFNKGFNIDNEFSKLVVEFNQDSKSFIKSFLDSIQSHNLSKDQDLILIDFALKTINADDKVEFSEIKFFETIRLRLKISDDEILEVFPEVGFYLVSDINVDSDISILTDKYIDSFELNAIDSSLFNS